jgi:hypothetical protein
MAAKKTNPLELNSNTLKELFKDRSELPTPSFSAGGAGIASTTGGRGTVSQAYQDYLANIDWKKRTPLQNALEFGVNGLTGTGEDIGREQQKKAIEQMKMEAAASKSEMPIQEEEIPTITVRKPKKQLATKLYRVMYAGKGAESSEVYKTKEEADAALKKAGGKGAVAGVNLSQETRGGEMLPVEDVQARKQRYMDQLSKTKEISKAELDRLKKIQALRNPQTEEEILQVAENKGRMSDALAAANEAKRAEDKKAGAGFESWRSNVKAGRVAEENFNAYNQQLGILKQAYTQAKRSGDLRAAYNISMDIEDFQAGIPKEMGARKKEITRRTLATRNAMLAEQEKNARTQAANPDYINSFNKPIAIRYQ